MSNTTKKKCDACNCEVQGGVSIGGTLLCRKCTPLVELEIDALRAAGKPANAPKIAAAMRKETLHAYILRDIPPELWERVQGSAARRNQTARELILSAIRKEVEG